MKQVGGYERRLDEAACASRGGAGAVQERDIVPNDSFVERDWLAPACLRSVDDALSWNAARRTRHCASSDFILVKSPANLHLSGPTAPMMACHFLISIWRS